jgi:hypothetical protein
MNNKVLEEISVLPTLFVKAQGKKAWPAPVSEADEALLAKYREKTGAFAPLIEQFILNEWESFAYYAAGKEGPAEPDIAFFCANQVDGFRM